MERSERAALPSRKANVKPSASLFEFDVAAIKQYEEYWGQQDVWYHGAAGNGRIGIGIVNLGDQLIDRREYRRSGFYNE